RVEAAARSEIAADIVHHYTRLLRRYAEHHRQVAARADRAAGPGMQGVMPGRRVELADRGARLHRHPGDPLHPGIEPDDMRGPGEGGLGRPRVADLAVEDNIGATLPGPRRARLGRDQRMANRGQHLVIDRDQLRGVLGCGNARPDDRGDDLTDVTYFRTDDRG